MAAMLLGGYFRRLQCENSRLQRALMKESTERRDTAIGDSPHTTDCAPVGRRFPAIVPLARRRSHRGPNATLDE
jgi:hypothetical protein